MQIPSYICFIYAYILSSPLPPFPLVFRHSYVFEILLLLLLLLPREMNSCSESIKDARIKFRYMRDLKGYKIVSFIHLILEQFYDTAGISFSLCCFMLNLCSYSILFFVCSIIRVVTLRSLDGFSEKADYAWIIQYLVRYAQ